jgi:hypothetical protein
VNGDTLVENNETFFVNLSNPTNGSTISDGQGLGTINNDDIPLLVIGQVYGGGNNSGATYQNDFIEIFNRGTTTVDFGRHPIFSPIRGGDLNFSTNKTDIVSGVLLPGHYFLIQEAGGTTNGALLPTPDVSGGTINLSATAGKVALVLGTANLSASGCPFARHDVSTSSVWEHGRTVPRHHQSPSPARTQTRARSSARTPAVDTNNNSADFSNPPTAPVARNSATTPFICP